MSAHEFNLYESLELPMDATEQDIITSYRRLARIHHPDKNPNDTEATARFQRIQTAHETLKDATLRRSYDAYLERGRYERHTDHHAQTRRSGPFGNPFFFNRSQSYHSQSYEDDDISLEDELFARLFGQRNRAFTGPAELPRFTPHRPRKTFAEMEREFDEENRKCEERRQQHMRESRRHADEHAAEQAALKARELAEQKREEEAKKFAEEKAAEERQHERWATDGITTEAEKKKTCHHDTFWRKIPQKKKFKCRECNKKRGMTGFKCPHCALLACQLCQNELRKRFAD